MDKEKWHNPTDQEKLNEAHEHFNLPEKKKKMLDWWDKVKISLYEDQTSVDFTEQKQFPTSNQTPKQL